MLKRTITFDSHKTPEEMDAFISRMSFEIMRFAYRDAYRDNGRWVLSPVPVAMSARNPMMPDLFMKVESGTHGCRVTCTVRPDELTLAIMLIMLIMPVIWLLNRVFRLGLSYLFSNEAVPLCLLIAIIVLVFAGSFYLCSYFVVDRLRQALP